jgi:hypothetical protein
MNENDAPLSDSSSRRVPWNKGKLPGAKPPLRPSHVWSIRTKLQLDHRTRDLALFNLAIDSKLRGCDVVSIRVDDVAERLHVGPCNRSPTEDRHTSAVRAHRSDPTGDRVDDPDLEEEDYGVPVDRSPRRVTRHNPGLGITPQ